MTPRRSCYTPGCSLISGKNKEKTNPYSYFFLLSLFPFFFPFLESCTCLCFTSPDAILRDAESFARLQGVMQNYCDLVLIDYEMGACLHGADAAASLRRTGFEGPIVIASSTNNISEMCASHGVTRVLLKPLTRAVLSQCLGELLPEYTGNSNPHSLTHASRAAVTQHNFFLSGQSLSVRNTLADLRARLSLAVAELDALRTTQAVAEQPRTEEALQSAAERLLSARAAVQDAAFSSEGLDLRTW